MWLPYVVFNFWGCDQTTYDEAFWQFWIWFKVPSAILEYSKLCFKGSEIGIEMKLMQAETTETYETEENENNILASLQNALSILNLFSTEWFQKFCFTWNDKKLGNDQEIEFQEIESQFFH